MFLCNATNWLIKKIIISWTRPPLQLELACPPHAGLDWKSNTETVCKKGMSRLYFLRKLRSFNMCSKMLEIFYQSVVASTIFFAAVCWGSSIRASDIIRLDKIIKKTGSALGLRMESFETVVKRRTLNKLLSIMDNDQHTLHHTVDRQRSTFSHRLLQLCKETPDLSAMAHYLYSTQPCMELISR